MTAVQTDSLVSYIEALEFDLAVADFRCEARQDSLKINLDILSRRLKIADDARAKWYHDPRLWFTAGVMVGVYVTGQVLEVTF